MKKLASMVCLIAAISFPAYAVLPDFIKPLPIEPELLKPTLPMITGMVFVKGGCFEMGDTFGNGADIEKPVHKVCVDDFLMGKYEVTQKEWVAVMGSNPSSFKNCDDCPVESVSWDDIQVYIGKLNTRTARNYRLPTEAEWEYAARSGGKREKYAGGDDLTSVAWYSDNSGNKTHQVGQKRANSLGIYDMSGNICEWVSDWYGDGYYGISPKDNPAGPPNGLFKVYRGGSWKHSAYARASYRYRNTPAYRASDMGFRVSAPAR